MGTRLLTRKQRKWLVDNIILHSEDLTPDLVKEVERLLQENDDYVSEDE